MKVRDFLNHAHQHLVTCLPDEPVEGLAKQMYAHSIGAMPVHELGTGMIGIVSERDLVRAFATVDWADLRHMRARDLMTRPVVSCTPDDTMQHAQDVMRTHHFRHLPVVENGRVIGMLSIRDTLALRLQETEEEVNVLRDAVVAARYR